MSRSAYQSESSGYSYDSHGYSAYSSPGPGGYFSYQTILYGYGSSAYDRQEVGSTTYINVGYENDYGGKMYYRATINSDSLESEVTYEYKSSYRSESYIHEYRLNYNSNSGYYYSGYGYNYESRSFLTDYQSVDIIGTFSNGYEYVNTASFADKTYSDGSDRSFYTETSQIELDGHNVAGSLYQYQLNTYTDAGGYTVSYASHT